MGVFGIARVEGSKIAEVLECREFEVEVRNFEGDSHVFVEIRPKGPHILAQHRDLAFPAAQQPDCHLLRGALSGTARSEKTKDFAVVDVKGDTLDGRVARAGIGKSEIPDIDDRSAHLG